MLTNFQMSLKTLCHFTTATCHSSWLASKWTVLFSDCIMPLFECTLLYHLVIQMCCINAILLYITYLHRIKAGTKEVRTGKRIVLQRNETHIHDSTFFNENFQKKYNKNNISLLFQILFDYSIH